MLVPTRDAIFVGVLQGARVVTTSEGSLLQWFGVGIASFFGRGDRGVGTA